MVHQCVLCHAVVGQKHRVCVCTRVYVYVCVLVCVSRAQVPCLCEQPAEQPAAGGGHEGDLLLLGTGLRRPAEQGTGRACNCRCVCFEDNFESAQPACISVLQHSRVVCVDVSHTSSPGWHRSWLWPRQTAGLAFVFNARFAFQFIP